jgi:hypothetical protein
MPSSYGRGVATVVFAFALTVAPYAHAADTSGINDPITDTIQLWSAVLNVIDAVAYQLASVLQPQSATFDRSSQQQALKTVRPSLTASAVLATQSLPETATTSGSAPSTSANPKQTPAKSLPETSPLTIYASPAFAPATPANVFVTQDQFNAALSNRIDPLIGIMGDLAALLPSLSGSSVATPQQVAGDGNPQAIGAGAAINQLSNVTITNPTITGLSASATRPLQQLSLARGWHADGSLCRLWHSNFLLCRSARHRHHVPIRHARREWSNLSRDCISGGDREPPLQQRRVPLLEW